MEKMMEKIKDRIVEKDSPIKSLKALAEAIGMSEGGFYLMFKKGTMKLKTRQAIAEALNIDESYFSEDYILNEPNGIFSADILKRIMSDIQEMKQVFEEQLRAKDMQIAGLQRTVDVLLGKSEGANELPLCSGDPIFDGLMAEYKSRVVNQVVTTPTRKKMRNTETKSMARRSSRVRTR